MWPKPGLSTSACDGRNHGRIRRRMCRGTPNLRKREIWNQARDPKAGSERWFYGASAGGGAGARVHGRLTGRWKNMDMTWIHVRSMFRTTLRIVIETTGEPSFLLAGRRDRVDFGRHRVSHTLMEQWSRIWGLHGVTNRFRCQRYNIPSLEV